MTRTRALELIAELQPRCWEHGYLVGLYGSLLLGETGRDLNLMLEPWLSTPDLNGLLAGFLAQGWTKLAGRPGGLLADRITLGRDGAEGQELLDLRVGRVRRRRADVA